MIIHNYRLKLKVSYTKAKYHVVRAKGECLDSLFDILSNKYPYAFADKYTDFQSWHRSAIRSMELVKRLGMNKQQSGLDIMEFGCGDGLVSYQLSLAGNRMHLFDIEDWRRDISKNMDFSIADVTMDQIKSQGPFDLIFSFDTFEHILDPLKALQNFYHILKDDGSIYLSFMPLYNTAFGLHAHNITGIPFPQFLFSEEFLKQKLNEIGIKDLGKVRDDLQPLNGFTLAQYEKAIDQAGFKIQTIDKRFDYSQLGFFNRHMAYIKRPHLTFDDYFLRSLKLVLKKK